MVIRVLNQSSCDDSCSGASCWPRRRKVSVSEFKGKMYVAVREFYEQDGQMKPGAKASAPAACWAGSFECLCASQGVEVEGVACRKA